MTVSPNWYVNRQIIGIHNKQKVLLNLYYQNVHQNNGKRI